jgi:hypothetical protein
MVVSCRLSVLKPLGRVDSSAALSAEGAAERAALQAQLAHSLDLQRVLEQHYGAKVRETEVRLELAQARQRQAELAQGEQRLKAEEATASFKQVGGRRGLLP